MIATHNQQAPIEGISLNPSDESTPPLQKKSSLPNLHRTSELLPSHRVIHHPKAGLNPLVDAAGQLFSLLNQLKAADAAPQLDKLHSELIHEMNLFQEAIEHQGYKTELVLVCRYILCATFDDMISASSWGGQGIWDHYSLLTTFNQDIQHQDKFFIILERAVKEPTFYIDIMELMYICLSMGYKGQYRSSENSHQIEQITNSLYKHIRAYRGSISKTLSPMPLKKFQSAAKTSHQNASPLFIFFVTACIIMTIFISLGYLMEVISNDAYKIIAKTANSVLYEAS